MQLIQTSLLRLEKSTMNYQVLPLYSQTYVIFCRATYGLKSHKFMIALARNSKMSSCVKPMRLSLNYVS